MQNIDSNNMSNMKLLNETEIDQVGGALAPLAAYALWVGGGAAVGFLAAAVVHYFGNGNHAH
ncbi:hypothetical protein ACWV27_01680 [Massilia varians]